MAPLLGRAVRSEWMLDETWLTVNHGSFGGTPRAVLAAQDGWRARMEAQPTRFFMEEVPAALRAAAGRLAGLVGADAEGLAFVENATVGCNAVLGSLPLRPGDEILLLDHGYGAVRKTARHVAGRTGAVIVEAALPFPRPEDEAVLAAVARALTPRTRLVILDHVTSPSALLLPVADLTRAAQAAGARVLIDGAHAPGQVPLDLAAIGADWYVGNCHKWLMAPKGCGFLWARADRRDGLHPVTISQGYGEGFLAEFDWTGTRDPTAWLACPAGIDFHAALGGPALAARNAGLAAEAGRLLAARLGTEVGARQGGAAAMAIVRLPLAGPATHERALALRARLMREWRTDAPLHAIDGAIWLRLSAQAYNERDDYDRLAEVAAALVADENRG
ncbi:MAG: aminotransferase class V-fold PLP-dependent enzyme [Dongiaceae bacterium]